MFKITLVVEGSDEGVLTWHNSFSGLCQLFNISKKKELYGHGRLPLYVLRWKGVEGT